MAPEAWLRWLTRFRIVRWWLGGSWRLVPDGKMSYGWMEQRKRRGDL